MTTTAYVRRTLLLGLLVFVIAGVLAACSDSPDEDGDTGNLQVTIAGLDGVDADVTVTGPDGFEQQVTATTTLTGLTPGSYTVSAQSVSDGGDTYEPTVSNANVNVAAGATASTTVTYTPDADPGALEVTVTGLGTGLDADVTVTGPDGFEQQVTTSTTLTGLTPGSYTVSAENVTDGGDTYEPTVSDEDVEVTAGATASSTVTYVLDADPGSLDVTITGLDPGVDADVTVTGPGGYTAELTQTDTLSDLVPGTYSVSATAVQDGNQTYTATVSDPEVEVPEGATASTTVTYAVAPLADDGDSEVNPGIWAQFRVTAGAPVWVDHMLFNEDDVLDVKGIELRNEIGEPDDSEDWLQFALVHGDGNTTTIQVSLVCPVQLEDGEDAATTIGRAEVLDEDGSTIDLILCGDTENVVIDNVGGSTDHLIQIHAATQNPHYVRYELSVNAYCFQECNFQPFEP